MVDYEWKVQSFNSCSVHKVGYPIWSSVHIGTYWNPEEVGFSSSGGMDLLARQGQAGREQNLNSSVFLHSLSAQCVVQIKSVSLCLMIQIKACVLPLQRSRLEVNLPTST